MRYRDRTRAVPHTRLPEKGYRGVSVKRASQHPPSAYQFRKILVASRPPCLPSRQYRKSYTDTITGITIGRLSVRCRRKRETLSARSSRALSRSAALGLRMDVSTDLRMMSLV